MSDRIRGALFNTLGDIQGLRVLDAFAGSGALGLEAASRGAGEVLLIESDKPAQLTVTDNIRQLQVWRTVRLVKANCSAWSDNNPGRQFDLVLCDPPYDDVQVATIAKLVRHVTAEGLLVVSWPGKQEIPAFDHFDLIDSKHYGDAQLLFYRRPDQ
jgi:16S rRNA (guanine966-N2)-methyltransferase